MLILCRQTDVICVANSDQRFFHPHPQSRFRPRRTYSYPGDGSWVHFEIPVGRHYRGSFANLVFLMDADAAGDARFRDLVV
jgi:hypothetical protein